MTQQPSGPSRRGFLKGAAAAAAAISTFHIVPRHVLGQGQVPPSSTVNGALIGCGGRGGGTWAGLVDSFKKLNMAAVKIADCDVKFVGKADNQKIYTDFRRLLERKDLDVVAIATPPHWHASISIAAIEAGKHVLCEKPMTRFIAEGRAVANAVRRYHRVFQIGTYGRFGLQRDAGNVLKHKIMQSGLPQGREYVLVRESNYKIKEWSGRLNQVPRTPPANLDWDMYCGPSPLKPFHPERHGGTHRDYWDYEGGGLTDMGQHYLDPVCWLYARDTTSPVEIEAFAPPAHPECTGMWGWVKLRYADGFLLVLESKIDGKHEWGEGSGLKNKLPALADLSEAEQKQIKAMPDPAPLLTFAEAIVQGKESGGGIEGFHRTACLMHLANLAIRLGRKIKYDPVKEQVIDDEEANRLVNVPMRAPWHL